MSLNFIIKNIFFISILCFFIYCKSKTTDKNIPKQKLETSKKWTESQGKDKEPTFEDLGERRDTLVISSSGDLNNMLSPVYNSATDYTFIHNINLPTFKTNFDCTISFLPGIAESWSFNEEQTILNIKLRKDIKWSDGHPLTAEDFKFTYDLIADPLVASPRLPYVKNMIKNKRPLIIDKHTLQFHYINAYDKVTMLSHASSYLVPAHKLKDADRATLRGHKLGRAPVVNGPFIFTKWESGSRFVLEPNPKFSGPKKFMSRLKRVIVKVLPEYATRLVELENGSIDYMGGILIEDADRISKKAPHIKFYRRGYRAIDYIGWNPFDANDYRQKKKNKKSGAYIDWKKIKKHPIFSDKKNRIALTKAINIDKLINDLLTSKKTGERYGKKALSTITPSLCTKSNNEIKPLPFDPKSARKELEENGWKDTNNNGILDKKGQEFSFTLTTNSGNPRRAKAAIIIQANLKDIGVQMHIEKLEANTFFDRVRKKDYEAALLGWASGLFVDMSQIWHSGDQYEYNFVSYDNKQVDQWIDAALKEPNEEKNTILWKKVQAQIYEDQPYTFLYWMDEIVALDKRFKDAKVNLMYALEDLYSWWVPQKEVKYSH